MLILECDRFCSPSRAHNVRPSLPLDLIYSMFCTCSRICSISTLSSSDDLRQLGVDRLRAERVRLAVQLLREEVEPLAGAAARGEHAADFGDVRGRAARAPRRRRSWSRTARAPASAAPRWGRGPLRAAARRASRRTRRGSPECAARRARPAPRCRRSARSSTACELGAFARARRGELGERLVDQRHARARRARPARRSARPARRASAGSRRPTAARAPGTSWRHFRRRGGELRATRAASTASAVAAGGGAVERDAALDLAALQLARRAARAAPARARATRPAA